MYLAEAANGSEQLDIGCSSFWTQSNLQVAQINPKSPEHGFVEFRIQGRTHLWPPVTGRGQGYNGPWLGTSIQSLAVREFHLRAHFWLLSLGKENVRHIRQGLIEQIEDWEADGTCGEGVPERATTQSENTAEGQRGSLGV